MAAVVVCFNTLGPSATPAQTLHVTNRASHEEVWVDTEPTLTLREITPSCRNTLAIVVFHRLLHLLAP